MYAGPQRRRSYLAWCAGRGLDPLAVRRPHLELYIRWMQEIRRFRPSTISRRFSVAAYFYRTCVIDDLLEHSPAGHMRRPSVPAESPTLGFTHLQFEALLPPRTPAPGWIVSYSMDSRMKSSLAVAALRNAIALPDPVGTIVHSDRGSSAPTPSSASCVTAAWPGRWAGRGLR